MRSLSASFFQFFFICLGLACANTRLDESLPPVLYFPGFGGNYLFVLVDDAKYIPSSCASEMIPIGKKFPAQQATSCGMALLTSTFDASTGSFASPEGIHVLTGEMGKFDTITPNNYEFVKNLESWGYKVGENLFGVPYDYRLMSDASFTANGFIKSVQSLVESASVKNNNQKIVIVGHSNGGPTMYTFLTSLSISQEWKDKYIAAMIGLSGNFLGQFNCITTFLHDSNAKRQDMAGSWEANYGSITWGDYPPAQQVTIVTTYANSPQETNYTVKWQDLAALFNSVGRADWTERLYGVYGLLVNNSVNMMDRIAHPLVDSYCLYGSEIDTSYRFVYSGDAQSDTLVSVGNMEGDGDQDYIDNTFGNIWLNDTNPLAKSYHMEAVAFPKVNHMAMYSDEEVMNKVYTILDSYRATN